MRAEIARLVQVNSLLRGVRLECFTIWTPFFCRDIETSIIS